MDSYDIDTANKRMRELYELSVQRIARANSTVLISGESGTGKERMANLLHHNSQRKDNPLVKVNCAALPEGVLESELFGHEKGAFTGATYARKGRFEMAHTGTIFLDEIADLTPLVQAKLLRVLQEREFERVGGIQTLPVDVRIIAATNKSLDNEVKEGKFREDLYFRLNVITVEIPPLRERPEDIAPLAQKFIAKFCEQNQRDALELSPEVIEHLEAFHWPGNVRQLENLIERLTVLAPSDVVTLNDLPPEILGTTQTVESKSNINNIKPLREAKAEFEKQMVEETLERCKGNVSAASAVLGIARKNLQEKIKAYGIAIDQYRGGRTDTEA
jgi:two-component system nitrogen regulation response regulator NtrX